MPEHIRESSFQNDLTTLLERHSSVEALVRASTIEAGRGVELLEELRDIRNGVFATMKSFIVGEKGAQEALLCLAERLEKVEVTFWMERAQSTLAALDGKLDKLAEAYVDRGVDDRLRGLRRLFSKATSTIPKDAIRVYSEIIDQGQALLPNLEAASRKASLEYFGKLGIGFISLFALIGVGLIFQVTHSLVLAIAVIGLGIVVAFVMYSLVRGRLGEEWIPIILGSVVVFSSVSYSLGVPASSILAFILLAGMLVIAVIPILGIASLAIELSRLGLKGFLLRQLRLVYEGLEMLFEKERLEKSASTEQPAG